MDKVRPDSSGDNRPMLWLVKGLGAGGAERLLLAQAERQAKPGDVTVAVTRPDRSHLVARFEAAGVRVLSLTEPGDRPGRWAVRLARLVLQQRPAVIHVHSPALAPLARIAGRLTGARLVYTEHNLWPRYRLPTRLANAATYPLDHVQFAVSDGVRDSVWKPLRAGVETLHHGVPNDIPAGPDARSAARLELGANENDVLVLTIANLRIQKAPLDMLAAAHHALEIEPRCKFVWVGQGPLEAEFRSAIALAGLADRFVFAGYRENAQELLVGADIFALSSHHEGLPVVLMEAQHAGVPVVATDVGGVAEAIGGDDPSGVLVAAGDPPALGAAIAALATDAPRREQFRSAALRRSPRFDGSSAFARLEQAYAG